MRQATLPLGEEHRPGLESAISRQRRRQGKGNRRVRALHHPCSFGEGFDAASRFDELVHHDEADCGEQHLQDQRAVFTELK